MNIKKLAILELLMIICFAIVPLFVNLPYRVNIFLSWEGAYRISQGQIPFKDFGLPLGGVYWFVPGFFMTIFGTQMITLIKAQVFINIIAGLSFRSILRTLNYEPVSRFLGLLVFILSFSFFNFWPWYNHSVIVYQLVSISFLLKFINRNSNSYSSYFWLLGSALFSVASFFTKQDGGALCFLICFILLTYSCLLGKKYLPLFIFIIFYSILIASYILYFKEFSFLYWFNYGQKPHSSRVSGIDIVNDLFEGSQWIKFYFFLIIIFTISKFDKIAFFLRAKEDLLPLLLTVGILIEALILQVTSYTPPDNNIFFHSFSVAFLFWHFQKSIIPKKMEFHFLIVGVLLISLWWSNNYWKYFNRIISRGSKIEKEINRTNENIVNRDSYIVNNDTLFNDMSEWKLSSYKSLEKIYLPQSTIDGIDRLMGMPGIRNNPKLKILNMTELTSLATEIPFELEKGNDFPLWFHLGVAMFNSQADFFESRIRDNYYDYVLFEYLPSLNNFYPFRVRDSLIMHYEIMDRFSAPRRGETQGTIEVFRKRK